MRRQLVHARARARRVSNQVAAALWRCSQRRCGAETGRAPGWHSQSGGAADAQTRLPYRAVNEHPPAVGSTRRLIMRSSVDLPEPEVPTMTAIEARGSTATRGQPPSPIRTASSATRFRSSCRPIDRFDQRIKSTAQENPNATIGSAPSSTRSIAVWLIPWKTKVPNPPAPISAATVARPMV